MAAMTTSCRTNDLNPDKGEVGGSSPGEILKNYQRTFRPLYRLNFSSQVITGISSHKA
jgi:hypothetical protein